MNYKTYFLGKCLLVVFIATLVFAFVPYVNGNTSTALAVVAQCQDGTDNDSDGLVDMLDTGCSNINDTDESNAALSCSLQKIWQLGVFDYLSGNDTEFPKTGGYTNSFNYTITGIGSPTPQIPGFLNDKLSPISVPEMVTRNLNLQFSLPQNLTNASVVWGKYGSETNTLLLDGQTVRTVTGPGESLGDVFRNNVTLSAGSHTFTIRYDNGGINQGNYLDAVALVGCVSTPPPPTCTTNSQCGTNGLTGGPFCQGNGVYQNYITYTCNNAGTQNSYCSNNTTPQLQQTCSANQTCASGTCNNVIIACTANSDCGASGLSGGPFCQGNGVYQNYQAYTCNNPGSQSSFCSNSISAQLQQTCLVNQTCSSGTCVNQNIACSSNSQCGSNGLIGGPYCWGNGVYQNYIVYTCNNSGTANSYCSTDTNPQLQQTCSANQTCSSGSCSNVNIVCDANSDCGTSGLTGGPFCQGNGVYRNYTTYTCNNSGTQNSYCSNLTSAQLQQTCSANQTCSSGACSNVNIVCDANSDCGTNGLTGGPFCQGNAIYQNYTTYTCNNPETQSSYCTNSTSAQLQQTCSANQTCSDGSCSANNTFARRGPGFWQTHTAFTTTTFNSMPLFIGVNTPVAPGTHKGIITTPGQVFGAYYSSIPRTTTNLQRSFLNRTRMILLHHLMTAKLNCAAFGCSATAQAMISNADNAYAGISIPAMHNAMSSLHGYNNSGNSIPIGSVGNATPGLSQSIADKVFWNAP